MSANPLVAHEENPSAYAGIGILDSAVQCADAISSGNWIDAGINTAATTLDSLAFATNPAGALLSYGIGWLIEHVETLSEPLDWLAGIPDAITAHAQTWGNVANAVSAVEQDYSRAVSGDLTAWRGPAAQAYRARATDTGHLLEALTIAADGIRVAITMSGMVVAAVRDQIQKMICDLVGYLIGYAAELVGSGGLATPVVAEQAMSLIAQWAAKIAELISRLLRTIKALMPLLRHLDDILSTVAEHPTMNGAVTNGRARR
ncbi:MAG: WXG100 family type VII secretion target [Pseudonocardiaceae bacterium]